ncbi:helix-turn-helix transcriptional regulator [Adlercreutzia equolifaciens]|uniref:helix-turn-helix transcriptional regulator n=1 Tax=Adlercreutzia equolifaciens TaxID=446660 RepID=UPI0023B0E2BC|nr:helix-turn-helix transcriptional regulator [Adlercreutzia equolifaciens]MDE8702109.1 helix-turn-helix transcriptional regulator [Adlercreutzia equolifaciens]
MYPISFSSADKNDPSVYLLNVVFFIAVIAISLALAIAACRSGRKRLSVKAERRIVLVTGLGAALGVLAAWALDISTVPGVVLAGVGMILVAFFVPVHFAFWSSCFAAEQNKCVLVDAMLSFALTAAYFVVYGALDLRVVSLAAVLPVVSAVLSVVYAPMRTPEPRSAFPVLALRKSSMFVACLVLLVLCNVAIAYFNNSAKLHADIPYRWVGFCGDIVIAIIIAALYYPARRKHRPTMGAFSVVAVCFVAALLLAVLVSTEVLQAGTIPLHCANAVLNTFTWLLIVRSAHRQKQDVVSAILFFLVAVILVPRFIQAVVMYGPNYLTMLSQSMDRVVVVALIAVLAVGLILGAIVRVFTTKMDAGSGQQGGQVEAGDFADAPSLQDLTDEQLDEARRAAHFENVLAQLQETAALSDREMDVARLTLKNYSAKKMADTLFVSVNTIYSHLKSIYRKTDVHSREEFIALVDRKFPKL